MNNFITARLKSPLSAPHGREARVTSVESPLSVPHGREASVNAVRKSPLSVSYDREASVTTVTKNPLSDLVSYNKHCREVSVNADKCHFNKIPLSVPYGREVSLTTVTKNPLSDLLSYNKHCREVSVNAVQCRFNNDDVSLLNQNSKEEIKNIKTKYIKKIKKDSIGITRITKKNVKSENGNIKTVSKFSTKKSKKYKKQKNDKKIEKDSFNKLIIKKLKIKKIKNINNKKNEKDLSVKIMESIRKSKNYKKRKIKYTIKNTTKINTKKIAKNSSIRIKKTLKKTIKTKISKSIYAKTKNKKIQNKKTDVYHVTFKNTGFMSSIEIENIDVTVLSWRYAMCIKCAMNCKGITLYDLFLSSNCCKEKHHKLSKRTCLLKGIGKCTAAVEYINATRKFNVNEYFEAKYHAKCAVQKSSQYKDNLNIHVNKLAKNILEQINRGESKEQSIPYFTLTELIVFSNKHKHEKKRDSHTCDYNTTLQSKSCSIMSSFIENSTISSNVPQRKSNKYLMLGGTNKIKEKYIEDKRVIPKKRKRKKKI